MRCHIESLFPRGKLCETALRRALAAAFALILLVAASALPASACGCGIYVPSAGDAEVAQERALIRWDGQSEDIVMSLGVLGESPEAAVIMPVPSKADVKLGDGKIFDELAELTKPEIKEVRTVSVALTGAAAPEGARVTVLARQQLGPFDVSTLSAADTKALGGWLQENSYYREFPERLAKALAPYAVEGWLFVAVRLRPGAEKEALGGQLDPLWLTFATERAVYPMRASANAKNRQTVTLYVLADHRVDKSVSFGSSAVQFAGWLEPQQLQSNSALAPFMQTAGVPRKWFLTQFDDTVIPAQVNDDFYFTFAASDTPFRRVRIVEVPDPTASTVATAALIGLTVVGLTAPVWLGCLLLFIIGGAVWMVRRRRRSGTAG